MVLNSSTFAFWGTTGRAQRHSLLGPPCTQDSGQAGCLASHQVCRAVPTTRLHSHCAEVKNLADEPSAICLPGCCLVSKVKRNMASSPLSLEGTCPRLGCKFLHSVFTGHLLSARHYSRSRTGTRTHSFYSSTNTDCTSF